MEDDVRDTNRLAVVGSRLRRAPSAAAGVIAIGLLVAACGGGSTGPGVASTGSSATPAANRSSSGGGTKAGALAYSQCMRSHGVPSFPDPNSNGQLQLQATPGSALDPNSPQFKAATQACKSLEPGPGTPAQQRQMMAGALKFAQCMRSHGVPNFPDPKPPQSGPQTQSQKGPGPSTQGFDPNSPQFKTALQACQHYAPGGGLVTSGTGGGRP